MEITNIKKKVLLLAGTLLVGALGSGLWEAALKPSLFWLASLALDVATLGMSSLRDSLYAEIAKGSYERASVMNMAVVLGILCGLSFGFALALLFKADNRGSDNQENVELSGCSKHCLYPMP